MHLMLSQVMFKKNQFSLIKRKMIFKLRDEYLIVIRENYVSSLDLSKCFDTQIVKFKLFKSAIRRYFYNILLL